MVTRTQLLSADVSEFVIEHRVERGRLIRVHRGVYRIVPQLSPWGRWMAACLACGPGAVVSHGSAAALWDLSSGPPQASIDITVVRRRCRHPGVRAHRTTALRPDETTRQAGVPVTTVARTVLDLAARGPIRAAERSLARALDEGLTSRTAVAELVERYPRRVGARRVRTLLADAGRNRRPRLPCVGSGLRAGSPARSDPCGPRGRGRAGNVAPARGGADCGRRAHRAGPGPSDRVTF